MAFKPDAKSIAELRKVAQRVKNEAKRAGSHPTKDGGLSRIKWMFEYCLDFIKKAEKTKDEFKETKEILDMLITAVSNFTKGKVWGKVNKEAKLDTESGQNLATVKSMQKNITEKELKTKNLEIFAEKFVDLCVIGAVEKFEEDKFWSWVTLSDVFLKTFADQLEELFNERREEMKQLKKLDLDGESAFDVMIEAKDQILEPWRNSREAFNSIVKKIAKFRKQKEWSSNNLHIVSHAELVGIKKFPSKKKIEEYREEYVKVMGTPAYGNRDIGAMDETGETLDTWLEIKKKAGIKTAEDMEKEEAERKQKSDESWNKWREEHKATEEKKARKNRIEGIIDARRDDGWTDEKIRASLIQKGYSEEEINEHLGGPATERKEEPKELDKGPGKSSEPGVNEPSSEDDSEIDLLDESIVSGDMDEKEVEKIVEDSRKDVEKTIKELGLKDEVFQEIASLFVKAWAKLYLKRFWDNSETGYKKLTQKSRSSIRRMVKNMNSRTEKTFIKRVGGYVEKYEGKVDNAGERVEVYKEHAANYLFSLRDDEFFKYLHPKNANVGNNDEDVKATAARFLGVVNQVDKKLVENFIKLVSQKEYWGNLWKALNLVVAHCFDDIQGTAYKKHLEVRDSDIIVEGKNLEFFQDSAATYLSYADKKFVVALIKRVFVGAQESDINALGESIGAKGEADTVKAVGVGLGELVQKDNVKEWLIGLVKQKAPNSVRKEAGFDTTAEGSGRQTAGGRSKYKKPSKAKNAEMSATNQQKMSSGGSVGAQDSAQNGNRAVEHKKTVEEVSGGRNYVHETEETTRENGSAFRTERSRDSQGNVMEGRDKVYWKEDNSSSQNTQDKKQGNVMESRDNRIPERNDNPSGRSTQDKKQDQEKRFEMDRNVSTTQIYNEKDVKPQENDVKPQEVKKALGEMKNNFSEIRQMLANLVKNDTVNTQVNKARRSDRVNYNN